MQKPISITVILSVLFVLLTLDQTQAEEIIWEKDGAKMALIPAGSFEMGDAMDEPEDWFKRSRPVHTVELDAFYMDVNEVTVGQFKRFVNESGYDYTLKDMFGEIIGWDGVAKYSPTDDHPMIYLSWDDATAYAEWAGKRLPTEAEWEYAARGGLVGKRYPWGDEITHDHSNYHDTGGKDKWDQSTAPVGSFDPNGYGLYDMAGNAYEWCADWYAEDYYANSPVNNPQGPDSGLNGWRVLHGGAWNTGADSLYIAFRNHGSPVERTNNEGFRCVSGSATAKANKIPTANAQSVSTNEDTAKLITLSASDDDGDTLTYVVVSQPGNGTLSGTAPSLTYTPNAGFSGDDSFTFKVSDSKTVSSTVTVSIFVQATPKLQDYGLPLPPQITWNKDSAKMALIPDGSFEMGDHLDKISNALPVHTVELDAFYMDVNEVTVGQFMQFVQETGYNYQENNPAADNYPIAEVTWHDAMAYAEWVDKRLPTEAEWEYAARGDLTSKRYPWGDGITHNDANYNNDGQGQDKWTGISPVSSFDPNGYGLYDMSGNVYEWCLDEWDHNFYSESSRKNPIAGHKSIATVISNFLQVESHRVVRGGAFPQPANYLRVAYRYDFKPIDPSSYIGFRCVSVSLTPGSFTLDIINQAPVAIAQGVSTDEDKIVNIDLSATDADGDALTYVVVSQPSNGILSGTAPSLTYTPKVNYHGSDTFTFKANDGSADSNIATVTITVMAVNDAPVANGQSVSTNEDTGKSITLSASDAEGNALTYTVVTQPSNGTLSGTAPDLTYTPNADYNGSDSLTFKANDGLADSNTATVTIAVSAVDDAPVAKDLAVKTGEDTAKSIVLSASDADGNALTYSVVIQPSNGTLSGTVPNLTYSPNQGFSGGDNFTFKANDGSVDSNTATVSITVTLGPVYFSIKSSYNEGEEITFTVTAPDPGRNEKFTYRWDFGDGNTEGNENLTSVSHVYKDNGEYKLELTVVDDNSGSVTQSETVKVKNLPPVIGEINIPEEVREGELFKLNAQAEDPGEEDTLKFAWDFGDDNIAEGNVVNHSYVNNEDYALTLTVQDNEGAEAQKTIILPVKNVDPIINEFTVPRGIIHEGDVVELSASGSDVGIEDILTYIWDFGDGNTAVGEKVNYVYTNDSTYQVKLTVRDSDDGIATRGQVINILNVPPVIKEVNMPESAKEGEEVTFSVIADDRGTDDVLSYLWIFGDGQVGVGREVTHAYTNNGIYQISVTVRDPEGGLATTDPSIPFRVENVAPVIEKVDDAPVAKDLAVKTGEDTAKSITLSASDVDGDALTYTVVSQPDNGILSGTAPNLTYKPNTNFSGNDSFTFRASDGKSVSNSATVSIVVQAALKPQIVLSAEKLDFGTLTPKQQANQTLTITNQGRVDLVVTSISSILEETLSINIKGPLTLKPNQSQQVIVTVKAPNSKGMIDLPLTIVSNDPKTPKKMVWVNAKLVGPILSISPSTLNFGSVGIKESAQADLTLANTGNAKLKVLNIQLVSNLFQLQKPFSSLELDADQKATIEVKFQPLAVGETSTNLIVFSDNGQQVVIKLSGSGSQPLALDVSETSIETVEVNLAAKELSASQSATTTVTITLKNKEGQLVKGATVNLTVDKGTIQTPATDNGDGSYTAKYTAADSAGIAKISAVTGNGKFVSATVQLLPVTIEISAAKTELLAGLASTTNITVMAKDSKGNLVTGQTVDLTVDKGTIQTPATDNNDGTYSAIYTAADSAGMVKISAVTSNGKFATTIKLLELVLSPSQSTVELAAGAAFQTGELAPVLVTLKTAGGLPISGREVTLTVDPADNVKLSPSVVTDQGGEAGFSLTSSQPGIRMITASVGEVKLDASVAVIFSGEVVDTIPIIAGIDPNRIRWEKDGAFMNLIPAGSFEMGDSMNDRSRPVHRVELDAFYMDVHEVTVGQFREFVNQSGYAYAVDWVAVANLSPGDDYPMVYVNWNDATAYCEWAGKRLPTEAEWEYAARGGLSGKRYPWGDEITHDNANWGNTISGKDKWDKCAPVGSFAANGYGLYDMAGNVSEWCADWFDVNYYSNSPSRNPQGPSSGGNRVLRGGSWYGNTSYLRVADRHYLKPPTNRYFNRGFRCVSGSVTTDSFTALPDNVTQPVTLPEETKTETPVVEVPQPAEETTPVVQPEFKVAALTSQKTAKQGANLSYVITLQGEGGFSDTLNLFTTETPKNVETSFSSKTVKLSTSQTSQVVELEVTVPEEIEAKVYDFTVLVTSAAGKTKTLPLKLTVEAVAKTNPVVDTVSIVAEASSLTADGTSTTILTITLKDTAKQALLGQTITLTADNGQVSIAKDNGDGTYTSTYTTGSEAGTATVTAKTANGKTSTLELTLTAKEPKAETTPSFTLSTLKSEQTGKAGGTISDLVKLQAKDGFSGKVTLFATDLPDGIKIIFDPKAVTLSAEDPLRTSQMTLKLDKDIKTGDYEAIILATSASGTVKQLTVKVKVETAELIATSILLTVNPKELLLDQSLEVFGQLANISDQEAVIPANNVITLTLTSPSDEISQFKVNTKEEGTYQLAAPFTPKEVGEWKISASFDGTETLNLSKRNTTFTVAKGLSVIAFDNEETIALGSEIELTGNLTPQLSQQKVSITMIKPDGSVPTPIEVETGDLGVFKQQVKFDMSGSWEITATWAGNDSYESVTKTLSVAVSSEVGKAILVLGGGDRQNNKDWRIFSSVAQSVYKVFRRRHFDPDDDIYYLSPEPTQTEGADGQTSLGTLELAITSWAKKQVNPQVPLYIYLLSHNLGDKFLLEKSDNQEKYLSPHLMDTWLDQLPEGTPVTIVIEACYSGNFISSNGTPTALVGENRTVIVSARGDKQSKIIARTSSFSRTFFSYIESNKPVGEAFDQTVRRMEKMQYHRGQHPQMDSNGDGNANQPEDYALLRERYLPADLISLANPPELTKITEATTLKKGISSLRIEVELVGTNITHVYATVVPPTYDPTTEIASWSELEFDEFDLVKIAAGKYGAAYGNFTLAGDYAVIVNAENADGFADPVQTIITVAGLAGDVNGDNSVNIFDLVMVAGQFGKSGAGLSGDVNGDSSVNIFDLVMVAGNFGKSNVAAAPTMIANKLTFTTQQKWSIQSAIVELEDIPVRSEAEELVLNLLIAILPDRLPEYTQLLPNYPNPFNPETWIPFELSQDSNVSVTIYNVAGTLVRSISIGYLQAGSYVSQSRAIYWDGKADTGERVASGTYFYTLKTQDYTSTQKMIILK